MTAKVFTGGLDFSRVNPAGLIVMAVGAAICLFAGRRTENRNVPKLIGLIICAGGALLAILG